MPNAFLLSGSSILLYHHITLHPESAISLLHEPRDKRPQPARVDPRVHVALRSKKSEAV
jgi:hypothetical protein